MSRLDRFPEDFKRLENLERMIKENLQERQLNVKQGNSTGKVDYLLSGHMGSIKDELAKMEKLGY